MIRLKELWCKICGGHFFALHDKLGVRLCVKCGAFTDNQIIEENYLNAKQ